MRVFTSVFITFLIPISLGVSMLLTLYFTTEYPFTKAMSLGVLYSLIPGMFLTLIFATLFTQLQNGNTNILNRFQFSSNIQDLQEEILIQEPLSLKEINENGGDGKVGQTMMLLLSKELIFEIIMTATKNQVMRSIITHNIEKGNIMIKTRTETVSIMIQSLTPHTSQIVIQGLADSPFVQNLIDYLKDKEHSFLQY